MKVIRTISTVFVSLPLLTACSSNVNSTDQHAHEEHDAGNETPTNRIDVPPTVRDNLGITFARVERREVANTIRVPGAFELQPRARHEYRITLPGRVDLQVDQYARIQPGDVLYRFRSPKWPQLQQDIIGAEQNIDSARAEINVARAKLTEAQAQLQSIRNRLEALASADFKKAELEAQAVDLEARIPRFEAELEQARTNHANAQRSREQALHRAAAAIDRSRSELSEPVTHDGEQIPRYRVIDWIEVSASESGVVQILAVTDGAYVEPPAMVMATLDPTQVRFRAMGMQSDLPKLMNGATARIAPPRTPGLSINDSIEAELTLGLEAHSDQRTITLIATPHESRSWARPGVSAFLEVVVESSSGPALAIPRSAIVRDGITHVFFRRDPNNANQVIRVEADMGVNDGRWVAIKSGLAPSDEVVLDGAYELKLASERSGITQEGGHFHADGTFHADH